MTDSSAHAKAHAENTTDAERSSERPGPDGARRTANWAWAAGSADYDWMDHAPLFRQPD